MVSTKAWNKVLTENLKKKYSFFIIINPSLNLSNRKQCANNNMKIIYYKEKAVLEINIFLLKKLLLYSFDVKLCIVI